MYPKIKIDLNGIIYNFKRIKEIGDNNNVEIAVVTKLMSDNREIVSALINNGARCICDSKIENLIDYSDFNVEKWIIRLPSLSEVPEVVKYCDVSLNSELTTIKALNEEASRQNKIHKVILMYELGDLREGCLKDDLKNIISEIINYKNIEIYGIGANLSCYGEILPSKENMEDLNSTIHEIENEFNIKLKVISGGNSSSYKMLKNGELPSSINNLRIGESIYLGTIPCYNEDIPELKQDNFLIQSQIIELKDKPSLPWGPTGTSNSLGDHTAFVDKGIRKKAIIGLGRQDINLSGITPLDKDITILAGSSDHIVLDVTDSKMDYKVGDIIEFKPNYAGVLSAMTSKYVKKEIEKN